MRNITITARDMRDGLRRIVERFGPDKRASDGSNTGCVYGTLRAGVLEPVCIIGQFFADLGLLGLLVEHDPTEWQNQPEFFGACTLDSPMWASLAEHGVNVEEDAQRFARFAQGAQDSGETWETAVKYATACFVWEATVEGAKSIGADTPPEPEYHHFRPEAKPEPLAEWEKELLENA